MTQIFLLKFFLFFLISLNNLNLLKSSKFKNKFASKKEILSANNLDDVYQTHLQHELVKIKFLFFN